MPQKKAVILALPELDDRHFTAHRVIRSEFTRKDEEFTFYGYRVIGISETFRPFIRLLADKKIPVKLNGKVNRTTSPPQFEAEAEGITPFDLPDDEKVLIALGYRALLRGEPYLSAEEQSAVMSRFLSYTRVTAPLLPESLRQAALRYAEEYASDSLADSQKRNIKKALQYIYGVRWHDTRELPLPEIAACREKLNACVLGMEPVKEFILETLAQIRFSGAVPKYGLLISGPPGVGKTSICQAIGELLNRPVITLDFSSISRDSDTITGSSQLYNNARPGLLLNGLQSAGTTKVVVILNELDKVTQEEMGSAVLSLLDGTGFQEVFLEAALPTHDMVFIATANDVSKIPAPLLNRFREVPLPGYTNDEKEQILTGMVLPKAEKRFGLEPGSVRFSKAAARELCRRYCRAPGVRDLEQHVERILGSLILRNQESGHPLDCEITPEELREWFGTVSYTRALRHQPGVVMACGMTDSHTPRCFPVRATCADGIGHFTVLGGDSSCREAARKAYYSLAMLLKDGDREAYQDYYDRKDVFIQFPDDLTLDSDTVSLAVLFSVLSAYSGEALPPGVVFIGETDITQNVMFDFHADAAALYASAKKAGDTIFASADILQKLDGAAVRDKTLHTSRTLPGFIRKILKTCA